MTEILKTLKERRKELGIPIDTIVRRTGVKRATMCRILKGDTETVRHGYVVKVMEVMGIFVGRRPESVKKMRHREAVKKAKLVARLTQGTMALEAQAVGNETLVEIERMIVRKILVGQNRKLWSD